MTCHLLQSTRASSPGGLRDSGGRRGRSEPDPCKPLRHVRVGDGEGLAAANPVANTNRREEKPRDRVLTEAELRTIWLSLADDDYGTIVKLLILTGQRKAK